MKTLLTSLSGKMPLFVILFGIVPLLLTGNTAQAQSGTNDYSPVHVHAPEASAPAFGAAIFPLIDPLKLKVLVRNPHREPLTLLIRNDQHEVIYRKELGRPEKLNTDFYLSNIADGAYTMEVKARSARFAKPIWIGTNVARVAQVR